MQEISDGLKEIEYGMQALILVMEALQQQFDLQYENKICAVLEVLIRQLVLLKTDFEKELELLDKVLASEELSMKSK